MSDARLHALLRYGAALGATLLATIARHLLDPILDDRVPFITYFAAVAFAAWHGGFGPALLAVVASALAADYFFTQPRHSFSLNNIEDQVGLGIFTAIGVVLALFSHSLHGALHRAAVKQRELEEQVAERRRAEEAVRQARDELEVRVQERTAELRTSEERTRLIVDTAHGAFIAMNADGLIVDWNRRAEVLFGWSRAEALGRDLAETVIPERCRAAHTAGLQHFLHSGESPFLNRTLEVSALHRDGHEFPAELAVSPLRVNDTWVFNAFVYDISERKKAEESLRAFAQELQRSNRELEQFALVASHDLQEPLRKIQAFGDRLRMRYAESLGEQGRDYVERMQQSATRMRRLIDDLLAFSRITTRAQPFSPVDLAAMAREVVSDLDGRLQQSGGQVEVGLLPPVEADPAQMRQLLQNLLANALKFHKPGVPPRVRIEGRLLPPAEGNGNGQAPSFCEIAVSDNGIGFDEIYLDRIFNVFQRLHGREEYEGTGMGLAICRKIVERHGGQITARSKPGEGSTFLVTLPRTQPQGEAVHAPAR